jgi:hypothetical protein
MQIVSILALLLVVCSDFICAWIYYTLFKTEHRNQLKIVFVLGITVCLSVPLLISLGVILLPFSDSFLSRLVAMIIADRPGLAFWIIVTYLADILAAVLAVRRRSLRILGIIVFLMLTIVTLLIGWFVLLYIILSGFK